MGQQLKTVVKRRRRKAYLQRKKALAKTGAVRRSSGRVKAAGAAEGVKAAKKAAAKKPAAKKVAKVKKADEAAVEAAPEAAAPEAAES